LSPPFELGSLISPDPKESQPGVNDRDGPPGHSLRWNRIFRLGIESRNVSRLARATVIPTPNIMHSALIACLPTNRVGLRARTRLESKPTPRTRVVGALH